MNADLRKKYEDPEFAEKDIARYKQWAKDNPEKHLARTKKWAKQNPEKVAKVHKHWYEGNKERVRKTQRAYESSRYDKDPNYMIRKRLRSRLYDALRRRKAGGKKAGSAVKDLGCTIESLISYLEAKFAPEMSWDNHGTSWELDHVKPLVDFDLTERKQFLEACHYTNLQPLWIEEHLAKTASEANDRCKGSTGHSRRSILPQKVNRTN